MLLNNWQNYLAFCNSVGKKYRCVNIYEVLPSLFVLEIFQQIKTCVSNIRICLSFSKSGKPRLDFYSDQHTHLPYCWNWEGLVSPRCRKPNFDRGCLWQSHDLCQGSTQGIGDKASYQGFLKGRNKEAGVNHRLVTFLNHSLGSQDA